MTTLDPRYNTAWIQYNTLEPHWNTDFNVQSDFSVIIKNTNTQAVWDQPNPTKPCYDIFLRPNLCFKRQCYIVVTMYVAKNAHRKTKLILNYKHQGEEHRKIMTLHRTWFCVNFSWQCVHQFHNKVHVSKTDQDRSIATNINYMRISPEH